MGRNNGDTDIGQSIRLLEQTIREKKEALKAANPNSSSGFNAFNASPQMFQNLQGLLEYGKEKLNPTVTNFRKELETQPWVAIGKVALVSFCAGVLIGNMRNVKIREAK